MDEGISEGEDDFPAAACKEVSVEQCETSALIQRACRLNCGLCVRVEEPPSPPLSPPFAGTFDFAGAFDEEPGRIRPEERTEYLSHAHTRTGRILLGLFHL